MSDVFEIPTIDQAKVEEFLAPYKALNTLAISNTEKLVTMQAASFLKYSNIALASAKEANEITDIEGTKAYIEKQVDVAKQVAEDMKADVQVIIDMNKAYFDEVKSVFTDNVEKAIEAAENVKPIAEAKAPAKRAKKPAAA